MSTAVSRGVLRGPRPSLAVACTLAASGNYHIRGVQTDIVGHRTASDGESHRATAPGARHYRRVIQPPRLPDVHIRGMRAITSVPKAQVKVSFDIPEYTTEVVAIGTPRLIEAVRDHALHGGRAVRHYQAGSSEMFGAAPPAKSASFADFSKRSCASSVTHAEPEPARCSPGSPAFGS
jgi:GDP-mannose 4,6 dehydratase